MDGLVLAGNFTESGRGCDKKTTKSNKLTKPAVLTDQRAKWMQQLGEIQPALLRRTAAG